MTKETGHKRPRHRRKPTEVAKDSKSNKTIERSIFSTRRIILAALIAALGGGAIYVGNRQEAKNIQTSADHLKSSNKHFEKTDKIIEKIEAGYLDFGKTLKPKLASISNNHLRNLITNTFDLVEKNEGEANYARFLWHFPQAGIDITFLDKDFTHFFYYVMTPEYMDKQRSNARFTGPMRIMQIRSNFDPHNTINRLTLMHELVHVEQDDEIRRSKNAKDEYYDQEKVLTIDTTLREGYSRACEVEAANAYLDGMLEKLFKNRQLAEMPTDVSDLANEITQKFGAREDQKAEIIGLIKLSMIYYFNGGAREEHLPPMFVKYVHDAY